MGKAHQLAGDSQPVLIRQIRQAVGNHGQQAGDGLDLAAEQCAFAGINTVGNLFCQQL
jgi:hypothetical protein